MVDSGTEKDQSAMRQHLLEVEVARLNTEIAVLKGEAEPAEAAARLLAMAASTVDQAMADARREADELLVAMAADAEARRDEANRVAQHVEAQTEAWRIEAHNQQAAAEAARREAERVTDSAADHITRERARVAEEVERLADVRTALERERASLESYHDELRCRVQELAESIVSFMTTEPAGDAVTEPSEPSTEVIAEATEVTPALEAPPRATVAPEIDSMWMAPIDDMTAARAEPHGAETFDSAGQWGESSPAVSDETPSTASSVSSSNSGFSRDLEDVEPFAAFATSVDATADTGPTSPGAAASEPDGSMVDPALPDVPATVRNEVPSQYEAPVTTGPVHDAGATPSFAEMMSSAAVPPAASEFGGVPVVDSSPEGRTRRKMGGLFSRSRQTEEPTIEQMLTEKPVVAEGLFGSHASRLIEQTSPDQLASALGEASEEDERFRSFLDGDVNDDPSRDWLLRNDHDE